MSVGATFDVKMQQRFLDREFADAVSPMMRRFFTRAGGAIRKTARQSLRKARRKKTSEMSKSERIALARWKDRYAAGKTQLKPVRPQISSRPGQIPLIHPKPQSLLKERIFFALARDRESVVIGPELVGRNRRLKRSGDFTTLEQLEESRPFMAPAFDLILPHLPAYLQQAKGK